MTAGRSAVVVVLLLLTLVVLAGALAVRRGVIELPPGWAAGKVGGTTERVATEAVEAVKKATDAVGAVVKGVRVSKTVYLNREGAVLKAGVDDASKNRSALVLGIGEDEVDIPAFTGSHKSWKSFVGCVEGLFKAYDVEIVDRRPMEGDFLMVVVGGRAKVLGQGKSVTGLAPLTTQPIGNAVVYVFSDTLRNNPRKTCETAGMEIAHAYGLDHAIHCKDIMTYRRPCGKRRFTDQDLPCGEQRSRTCENGEKLQNSHRRLLEVLGPAKPKPPAKPRAKPKLPKKPATSTAGHGGHSHSHGH